MDLISRVAARLALAFNLLVLLLNLSIPIEYILHGMPKADFAAFYTAGGVLRARKTRQT